ncbi:MAG: Na+/H+ antiporter NhaC family protein, partial [Lachnospiraceae bacterium]|nr:Na+/H+ antiporter NhaC family protein [Lachnospiraceae bacterium]
IPYNYYAIFTMIFIIATTLLGINFGKMKKCEDAATNGDLFYGEQVVNRETSYNEEKILGPGKVIDLVIPIITLVVLCIIGLIYSGGFYSSDSESFSNFVVAFSNADASVGLAMGSMFALILTMIYYLVKKVLSFNEIMSSLTEGFKNMVPAILILTFAWTLKAMIDSLEATAFIDGIVRSNVATMSTILPAIIFLLGAGISFATGTSWGTFGILIPIVVYILKAIDPQLMIIGISAAMAGSVFGDHCSPISDTTIMSSAGAQCEHLLHVSTQLSYAVYVAVVSFICYIVAGITKSPFIPLIVGVVVLLVGLFVLKNKNVSA